MYDPYLIITTKRMEHGTTPYGHQSKPQLEELANQESWEDVQRILQVQIQDFAQSSHHQLLKLHNNMRRPIREIILNLLK
jgi:hypothetical protein